MSFMAKTYDNSFVLDKSKLSRIVDIIEQHFGETGKNYSITYHGVLKSGKNINLNKLEELFNIDNTIANPLKRLDIEAQVENGKDTLVNIEYSGTGPEIIVYVKSEDTKWANQVYAQLEEQVERTVTKGGMPKQIGAKKFSSLLYMTMLVLVLIIMMVTFIKLLSMRGNYEPFIAMSKSVKTMDDKINFLYEYAIYSINLRSDTNKASILTGLLQIKGLMLWIPALIIFLCLVYILEFCYPQAVFLWGDYEDHYSQILARRKFLWTTIILSFVVGIIANFFVIGLSPYIK